MTNIIIIDPNDRTVAMREIVPSHDSHAQQIQEIIGGNFCLACLIHVNGDEDVCYVEEEGVYKYTNSFALPGWGAEIYAGIGVITGLDRSGGTVSAHVSLDEVKRRVLFSVPAQEFQLDEK